MGYADLLGAGAMSPQVAQSLTGEYAPYLQAPQRANGRGYQLQVAENAPYAEILDLLMGFVNNAPPASERY